MKKVIRLTESDLARIVKRVISENKDNLKISINPDSTDNKYNNLWVTDDNSTYVWELEVKQDYVREVSRGSVVSFDINNNKIVFTYEGHSGNFPEKTKAEYILTDDEVLKFKNTYDSNRKGELISFSKNPNNPFRINLKFKTSFLKK